MRTFRRLPGLSLVVFLGLAGSAHAAGTVLAPPGHAGANQYVEVIPTSAGNAAPPGSVSGSGNPAAGPSALSGLGRGPRTDAQLAKLGKTGHAAAALAAATAPTALSAVTPSSLDNDPSGRSAASGLADALAGSDSGGLGVLLPLMLGTALVVFTGLGIARLRRRV